MQNIALFYNPVAGMAGFAGKLDRIIYLCQEQGLQAVPFRIRNGEYIRRTMEEIAGLPWHTIAAAGGDGTINQVVDAMMHCGVTAPLALFPEGTSNDLANYLRISRYEEEYCRLLTQGNTIPLDVGRVQNRYFINVAAAGFITETAHEVDHNMKNLLGRIAYLLKGLEKIPQLRTVRMTVVDDLNRKYDEEIFFFMILNGGMAGGFRLLPVGDALNDGYLDLVALKKVRLPDLAPMLLKQMQSRQLIDNDAIFYCRARSFDIDLQPISDTDLDGERGPQLPWHVECCPRQLTLRVPVEDNTPYGQRVLP